MGRLKPFRAFGKLLEPGESSILAAADWVDMAALARHQETRPRVFGQQMMAFASQEVCEP